jgi:hypothetical protein
MMGGMAVTLQQIMRAAFPSFRARKVWLPGHGVFWFAADRHNAGPLGPLDHFHPNGWIRRIGDPTARGRQSYAHVYPNGAIKRYGVTIGHRDDLRPPPRTKKPRGS